MKTALLAMLVFGIISSLAVTPIHALPNPQIYAHTDRASYLPGDTGTLFITVRNEGTSSFGIRNLTITYPWKAFITDHWDGNSTYTFSGVALAQGGTWNQQYSFTVPTDGRAAPTLFGGTISITMGTDIGSQGTVVPTTATMIIAEATYSPFGVTTSILPVISIVLLGVAVVMLALVYMGIRKLSKK